MKKQRLLDSKLYFHLFFFLIFPELWVHRPKKVEMVSTAGETFMLVLTYFIENEHRYK